MKKRSQVAGRKSLLPAQCRRRAPTSNIGQCSEQSRAQQYDLVPCTVRGERRATCDFFLTANRVLTDRPKLRYLESLPFKDEGRQLILLRDPTKISEQALAVAPELYSLLLLFDGKHSILDIQAEMTRRQGQIVLQEELSRLLAQLDSAYFLENENFRRHHSDLVETYRGETVRKASHAGVRLSRRTSSAVRDTQFVLHRYEGCRASRRS